MKIPVGTRKVNLCWHPGCQGEGVPCYSASGDEGPDGFYCFDHCQEHGFCYSCGLFWGGIEFFDFGNGHCVNCPKNLEPEFREEDFDRRTFDEIIERQERLKYYRGEVPKEVSHCDPFPEKIGLRCKGSEQC